MATGLSCTNCRLKKQRCSRTLPVCDRCTSFGLDCRYPRRQARRRRSEINADAAQAGSKNGLPDNALTLILDRLAHIEEQTSARSRGESQSQSASGSQQSQSHSQSQSQSEPQPQPDSLLDLHPTAPSPPPIAPQYTTTTHTSLSGATSVWSASPVFAESAAASSPQSVCPTTDTAALSSTSRLYPWKGKNSSSTPLDATALLYDAVTRVRELRLRRVTSAAAVANDSIEIPPETAKIWVHNYFENTPPPDCCSTLLDRKLFEMMPDLIKAKYVHIDACIVLIYYYILWQGCFMPLMKISPGTKDIPLSSNAGKHARQLYLCCLRVIPVWQKEATGTITDFIAAMYMAQTATENFDNDLGWEMHRLACEYAKGLHLHSLDDQSYLDNSLYESGQARDENRRALWHLIQMDLFYRLVYNQSQAQTESLASWRVNLPWLSDESPLPDQRKAPSTMAFLVRSRVTFVVASFFDQIQHAHTTEEALRVIEPLCVEIDRVYADWDIDEWFDRYDREFMGSWALYDVAAIGYVSILFMLRKAHLLRCEQPRPIASDEDIPRTSVALQASRRLLGFVLRVLHLKYSSSATSELMSIVFGIYRAYVAYAYVASTIMAAGASPMLPEQAAERLADLGLLENVTQGIETNIARERDFAPLVKAMKQINAKAYVSVHGNPKA